MKTCTKCKINKKSIEFSKDKTRKNGLYSYCKTCLSIYYQENKKIINIKTKKYHEENKETIKIQRKQYREKNKEPLNATAKKYRIEHKEEMRKYLENNKLKIAKQHKKYKEEHKEQIRAYKKKYNVEYQKRLDVRIVGNMRTRVRNALKRNTKDSTTMKLVGCTLIELKNYLESQFKPGMSWNNYGRGWLGTRKREWNIDHIIPCASFDLSRPEEQKKCFYYSNLQPLWAEENYRKGQRS